MQPRDDSWNVVVTGAWNPLIFQPGWVTANLISARQVKLHLPLGLGEPFRVVADNVSIIALDDRLVVSAMSTRLEDLTSAGEVAAKALNLLSHTPITAFGVNLGFQAPYEKSFNDLFKLPDAGSLAGIRSANLKRTQIARTFAIEELQLNLLLSLEGDTVTVDCNFHQQVRTASEAGSLLPEAVIRAHVISNDVLSVYRQEET